MQFGSGWWHADQQEGMEWQMKALANTGLLSRFIGMLTDSRSFLSFPRHEYFRRTLCNLIGEFMARWQAARRLRPRGQHGETHQLPECEGVSGLGSGGLINLQNAVVTGIDNVKLSLFPSNPVWVIELHFPMTQDC